MIIIIRVCSARIRANPLLLGMIDWGIGSSTSLQRLEIKERRKR
jgi:hypothetical protein